MSKKTTIEFKKTKDGKETYTLTEIKNSKELKIVSNGLAEYIKKTEALQVNNQDDYKSAGDFLKNIKVANKKIDDKRKFFSDPYYRTKQKIDKIFKSKTSELTRLKDIVEKKMLTWYAIQQEAAEKERLRLEKENQKKLERFQAKQEKHPKKVYAPPVINESEVKIEQTSKTENSMSIVNKNKKWKVIDISKVPREYLCINTKKVDAVVKIDVDIPGIEIYYENSLVSR